MQTEIKGALEGMVGNLPKFNDLNYVHFITTRTFKKYPYFKDDRCCLILVEELDFYRKHLGFKVLGYVIMPEHLHCLIFWDVEEYPKLTISEIMMGVKGYSAKLIIEYTWVGRGNCPCLPVREKINYIAENGNIRYGKQGFMILIFTVRRSFMKS